MARNGDVVIIDGDDEPIEKQQTSHERTVEELFDTFKTSGADIYMQVYKVGHSANDLKFCCQIPADKYDYGGLCEFLRVTYGGGDFRLHVRQQGKRGLLENKLLQIEKTMAVPMPAFKAEGEIGQAISAFGAMMAENQRQMIDLVARMNDRPQVDQMAQMSQMFVLMKGMREAMGMPAVNPAVAPAAPVDPFTQLASTLKSVGMIKELLGVEAGGGGDTGDSIVGLLKEQLPSAMELFKREQDLRAMTKDAELKQAQQRQANPAPRPVQQQPQINPQVSQLLGHLQKLAEQDVALDADTDPVKFLCETAQIREFLATNMLNHPSPFKALCQYWPQALDYAPWWIDLIDLIQERLTTEADSGINAETTAKPVPDDDLSGGADN